jgi:hypothetical protein
MKIVMLLAFAALVSSAADVTGRWSGKAEFVADGQPRQVPVMMDLKQDGAKVTGTIESSEGNRHEITAGKIEGDKVQLQVETNDGPARLELNASGDQMAGDAYRDAGDGFKPAAKVSVTRVKQ